MVGSLCLWRGSAVAIEVTGAVLVAVAVDEVAGDAEEDIFVVVTPFNAAAAAWSCSVSMVTDLAWPELSRIVCLERDAFLKDGLDIFGSGIAAAMAASCLASIS